MVYKRAYNASINPPAPFVNMTVIHPINKSESIDVDALVDTGADITLINRLVVESLHLVPNGFTKVGDFEGNVREKPKYLVGIAFGSFSYAVEATETDGLPILGRDILNRITTLLRGPARQMEMS